MANQTDHEWCLPDIFGPYIPILVPWTDLWAHNGRKYPEGLMEAVLSVLRPNVPYLILVDNAEGWDGRSGMVTADRLRERNLTITILSPGGYGHVPVPLIKGDMVEHRIKATDDQESHLQHVSNRKSLTTYVGKLRNAPKQLRKRMDEDLEELGEKNNQTPFYRYHYGYKWTEVMQDAKFNLAPRGFGRTAFHVMEVLQMGLIPIHVYSDIPWIPYGDLLTGGDHPLAYAASMNNVTTLVREVLAKVPDDDIQHREAKILRMHDTHFSLVGVMRHIDHFLLQDGKSDLACQTLPKSVRDFEDH